MRRAGRRRPRLRRGRRPERDGRAGRGGRRPRLRRAARALVVELERRLQMPADGFAADHVELRSAGAGAVDAAAPAHRLAPPAAWGPRRRRPRAPRPRRVRAVRAGPVRREPLGLPGRRPDAVDGGEARRLALDASRVPRRRRGRRPPGAGRAAQPAGGAGPAGRRHGRRRPDGRDGGGGRRTTPRAGRSATGPGATPCHKLRAVDAAPARWRGGVGRAPDSPSSGFPARRELLAVRRERPPPRDPGRQARRLAHHRFSPGAGFGGASRAADAGRPAGASRFLSQRRRRAGRHRSSRGTSDQHGIAAVALTAPLGSPR